MTSNTSYSTKNCPYSREPCMDYDCISYTEIHHDGIYGGYSEHWCQALKIKIRPDTIVGVPL